MGVNSTGFFVAKLISWLVLWFVLKVVFSIGWVVGGLWGRGGWFEQNISWKIGDGKGEELWNHKIVEDESLIYKYRDYSCYPRIRIGSLPTWGS